MWMLILLKKVPRQVWYVAAILAAVRAVYGYGYHKGRASIPELILPPETVSPGTVFIDSTKYLDQIDRLKLLLEKKGALIRLGVQDSNCLKYIEQLTGEFRDYQDSLKPFLGLLEMALFYPDSLKDVYREIPGYDLQVTVYPKRSTGRFKYNPVKIFRPQDRRFSIRDETFLALYLGAGYNQDEQKPGLMLNLQHQRWLVSFSKFDVADLNRNWEAFLCYRFLKF